VDRSTGRQLRGGYEAILGPERFERAGPMKWVRTRRPPIRDVIQVYALKGGMYTTRWGVSLDFVPHVVDGTVRWHRTARSARIDLGYDPLDFVDPRVGAWNARPSADDPAFEPLSLVDPAQARVVRWEISAARPTSEGPNDQNPGGEPNPCQVCSVVRGDHRPRLPPRCVRARAATGLHAVRVGRLRFTSPRVLVLARGCRPCGPRPRRTSRLGRPVCGRRGGPFISGRTNSSGGDIHPRLAMQTSPTVVDGA
jgi:hypothetical protein